MERNECVHQGRIVARYRKAANWSQSKLAECMRVSIHTVQRMEQEAMIKDLNRRKLLVALLGIPAAYMMLDEGQLEIETSQLLFNDDPMSFIEDMVNNRWQLQLMGGPLNAVHGLGRTIKEIEYFAWMMQGKEWHQRANAQLCLIYQLQGSIQGDKLAYDKALAMYAKAFVIADKLSDNELKAAVRTREAIVFMRQEKPLLAIQNLKEALDLIQGQSLPHLRGNILILLSEAHAKAQQSQECWRSIGLAERVLGQTSPVRERSYRIFNPALVLAHKGTDALLLHDYERALALIDKSLKTYTPTLTPGRARLLARKAEAFYGLGSIDGCTSVAEEALLLAKSVGASNTLVRVANLHTQLALSSWKREPDVTRLGALIAMKQ